jgi:hypothetical protein
LRRLILPSTRRITLKRARRRITKRLIEKERSLIDLQIEETELWQNWAQQHPVRVNLKTRIKYFIIFE